MEKHVKNSVKILAVEVTSMAILGMVNWTYKWYKTSGPMHIDEISNVFLDLILRSILNVDLVLYDSIY